jgi:hypothetical protein
VVCVRGVPRAEWIFWKVAIAEVTDALDGLHFSLRFRLLNNMILLCHEYFSGFPSFRMLSYYAKAHFDSGASNPNNPSSGTE